MDQYTQAAAAYLRSKRGVTSVSAETSTAVSELEIANWESQNLPHELPEEYKALLRNSNGFRLTWDLIFRGEPIQLGEMCINPLRDVKKVQLNVSVKDDREPLEKCLNVRRSKLPVAAFSLDKHCKCGVVALVYFRREMGSKEAPEVWFQDLSGRWNFLSSTFIVYFRMMVAHLGLPNWQYRFTEYGMDPISKQWFFLISPDKFTFDLNSQNVRGEKMGNASAGGTNRPVSKVTAGGPTPKLKSAAKGVSSRVDSGLRSGRASKGSMPSSLSSGSGSSRDGRVSSSRRRKQSESQRELLKTTYRVRPRSSFN